MRARAEAWWERKAKAAAEDWEDVSTRSERLMEDVRALGDLAERQRARRVALGKPLEPSAWLRSLSKRSAGS